MYKKRIEWTNELGDDKDKYTVIVQNGKVGGIYCNRCDKPVNFRYNSDHKSWLKTHNDAHKYDRNTLYLHDGRKYKIFIKIV
uniref:C2H2-type domain-containing protein n=1 Tax=Meloidogyne hapla TaxID=6305 RepID=A0A1I8BHS1_MELHA